MSQQASFDEQRDFEDTVRRLARSLWPGAAYQGAQMVDGRERDGVFETEEVINIIECTVSRKKEKAEYDIEKLATLWKKKRTNSKPVKCWFITLEEPTADQRGVAENYRKKNSGIIIEILSIDQFRAKLLISQDILSVARITASEVCKKILISNFSISRLILLLHTMSRIQSISSSKS